MTQLPLDFSLASVRKTRGPDLARQMMALLYSSPGWTTRAEFKEKIGLTDRQCRIGCEYSKGNIIFGQLGYKLRIQSTEKEISECLATIISQIKKLQIKYSQISGKSHEAISGRIERIA